MHKVIYIPDFFLNNIKRNIEFVKSSALSSTLLHGNILASQNDGYHLLKVKINIKQET